MKFSVVPFLFALTAITEAAMLLFPSEPNDPCTDDTGETGRCSYSCNQTSSKPRICGIKDTSMLYCCGKNIGNAPEVTPVINSPIGEFECGTGGRRPFGCIYQWSESASFCRTVCFSEGSGNTGAIYYWPWMALIGNHDGSTYDWFCGGALINHQWVLTAAHCIISKKVELVRLGEYNYDDECDEPYPEDFTVSEILLYPEYNFPEAYHDLALLKLSTNVTIQDNIGIVCLPWGAEGNKAITGQLATVTGWGLTQHSGLHSSKLRQVNVTVFQSDHCDQAYSSLPFYKYDWPQGIGHETLCAGDPSGGRDACQGDSGGPLVSQDSDGRFTLGGIISKGNGCGDKDYPGIYANLRHSSYLAWIKKVAFGSQ